MSQLKAKVYQIHMPESAGIFEWVFRTKHPTDAVDAAGYFDDLNSHLSKFQRVRVIAERDDGSWDEAMFAVLHSEVNCVLVKRLDSWVSMTIEIAGELKIENKREDAQGREIVDVVDTATGRTVRRGLALIDGLAAIEYLSVRVPEPKGGKKVAA